MLAPEADIIGAAASSAKAVAAASALSIRGISMAAWTNDVHEHVPVAYRFGFGSRCYIGCAEQGLRNTLFGSVGLVNRF